MTSIEIGQFVVINSSRRLDGKLRRLLESMNGKIVCEVIRHHRGRIWRLALPQGISLLGFSKVITSGDCKGRKYIELDESHLTVVS